MEKGKRGMSGFAKGMLIYILIFLVLAAAVLFVLRLYLRSYELSRPAAGLDDYLDACRAGELDDWRSALAGIDTRIQSEEEGLAFVRNKIERAACREVKSETTIEKRYGLFDEDGLCFAKLTLRQGEDAGWGFRLWEVVGVECELGAYMHSYGATVPSDYRVFLGDTGLDDRFIVETDISYTILESCRELVPRQPTMVRYEVGAVAGHFAQRVDDDALGQLAFGQCLVVELVVDHEIERCAQVWHVASESLIGVDGYVEPAEVEAEVGSEELIGVGVFVAFHLARREAEFLEIGCRLVAHAVEWPCRMLADGVAALAVEVGVL